MATKKPDDKPYAVAAEQDGKPFAVQEATLPYGPVAAPPPDIFSGSFESGPREKIAAIRRGIPARRIGELSIAMDISKENLMDSLGLPRATVNRKAHHDQALSPDESERVIGMQALVGQVQALVQESGAAGAAGFDTAKWLARWLNQPLPALGGDKPAAYMDTVEGQKLVGRLLAMIGSGAYA